MSILDRKKLKIISQGPSCQQVAFYCPAPVRSPHEKFVTDDIKAIPNHMQLRMLLKAPYRLGLRVKLSLDPQNMKAVHVVHQSMHLMGLDERPTSWL